MVRIVSVIPPKDDSNITKAQGTKILLDNGEYLRCVHKITLVAEVEAPWKAIIEVYPQNQDQIDAVLADLKVLKIGEAKSRLIEIQEEMQKLQDEKAFLEHEHGSPKSGVWTDGVDYVPKDGTWLLHGHETVLTPKQNDSLTEIMKVNSQLAAQTNRSDCLNKEGTWLLEADGTAIPISSEYNGVLEKVHEKLNGSRTAIPPATDKVKDIHGVIHSQPDLKGEHDESK
ncbi:hypothetical protein [Acinetobacter pittii]|uniref:Uncharacterized protein n=1 Tax=Acinetobacter pittii TaxID=48296 RepID=A0AAE9S8F9_ACIPI|nr:hypothetical protein [Acinetobacter pittii]USU94149.1 hypothetical protein MWH18_17725 [Acinetobacter pittii]